MKQTIDIHTYTWFDRTYGNTYFAQEIILNYGTDQEQRFKNPFQYGYGSYEFKAFKFLKKQGLSIPDVPRDTFIVRNYEQEVKKAFFKANGLN